MNLKNKVEDLDYHRKKNDLNTFKEYYIKHKKTLR